MHCSCVELVLSTKAKHDANPVGLQKADIPKPAYSHCQVFDIAKSVHCCLYVIQLQEQTTEPAAAMSQFTTLDHTLTLCLNIVHMLSKVISRANAGSTGPLPTAVAVHVAGPKSFEIQHKLHRKKHIMHVSTAV